MKSLNGKLDNRSRERGLDRGEVDASVANYSKKRNWAKAGALGAGLCLLVGGASGCGEVMYGRDSPVRFVGKMMPEVLVPYGLKKQIESEENTYLVCHSKFVEKYGKWKNVFIRRDEDGVTVKHIDWTNKPKYEVID